MRIAQLAPLSESVPPTEYGGTELVVSLLTEELVKRGHDVTLFASGDSQTSAQLVSVTATALRKNKDIAVHRWPAYDLTSLLKLKDMAHEFDIIHNHMGYQALPFAEEFDCKFVSTNHNPIKPYNAAIYSAYAYLPFIALSAAYKRLNLPDEINYISVVANGIDLQKYNRTAFTHAKPSYLLFLGRVCADKGTAEAIEIAGKLSLPLKIAGKVDKADEEYFETKVKPKLTLPGIEFIGEVDQAQKVDLYANAIAVVYPIAFEEPFGLVMAEALASGCPVMAFDRGSVREILQDGKTAVIGSTVDELVLRFSEIQKIDRQACRQAAEAFGKEAMTSKYEAVYAKLLNQPASMLVH
jgi:glycosyltransferase involved in cell wall biosynthesis